MSDVGMVNRQTTVRVALERVSRLAPALVGLIVADPGAGRRASYRCRDVSDVEEADAIFVREGRIVKGLKTDQTGRIFVLRQQ